MSDTAFYENQYEAAPQSGRWKSMFGGLAAAALSLAMLGAVVVWAYQISVRDAHDVPVVRAIDGPIKQRPEDTGGLKLRDSEVAVNRIVSGDDQGGAAKLAPAGEGLAPEDKPVAEIRRETDAALAPPQLKPAFAADEAASVASAPGAAPVAPEPAPEAPAISSAEPAITSSTGTPVAALDGDATALAPDQSPPVAKRPETLDTTTSAATSAATSTNTPVESAPIPIGEPVVQLGAFTSRQLAERVWKDQEIINQRLFRGLEPSITPVQSGGRELYRLRIGPFGSADEAKKICVVLKARGTDCIVTRSE